MLAEPPALNRTGGERLDEPGRVRGIAERRADLGDTEVESPLEIDERAVVPDLLPQRLSGDDLARVGHEDGEDAGRLRLETDWHAFAGELARGGIEFEETETRPSVHRFTTSSP